MRAFFILSALFVFAAASGLLRVDDLNTIVKLLNQHRNETEETLKPLVLSEHLTMMADGWIAKCTLEHDHELKQVYSTVLFNTEMKLIPEDLINNVIIFQQGYIEQFQPHELVDAPNWAALMSDKATEVGCSLAKCGETYSFGCLVNPKPTFPERMPYNSTCKPERKHAVDCDKVGNCGTYFDGCFKVVCGPTCLDGTNQARSERTDHPQQRIATHTRVRTGEIAETDNEESMKRGPGNSFISANAGDNVLQGQYSQSIISQSGRNILVMQTDGNLVLYDTWRNNFPMWQSGTARGRFVIYIFVLHTNGNAAVWDVSTPNVWLLQWQTGTTGIGSMPFVLQVQDDGNVFLYAAYGATWSTWTANPPPVPSPPNNGAYRYARNERDEIAE